MSRSLILYLLTGFFSLTLGILSVSLYSRILEPNIFGKIAIIILLINFITPIITLNIQDYFFIQFDTEDISNENKILTSNLFIIFTTGILGVFFLIFSDILNFFELGMTKDIVYSALIVACLQQMSLIYLIRHQLSAAPRKFLIFKVLTKMLEVISVFIMILISPTLQNYVLGLILAGCVLAVYTNSILIATVAKVSISFSYILNAAKYGLKVLPYTYVGLILLLIERNVVVNTVGLEILGLYFVASQIVNGTFGLLIEAGYKFYQSIIFGRGVKEIMHIDASLIKFFVFVIGCIVISSIIFALVLPIVSKYIVSPNYWDGLVIMPLLCVANGLVGVFNIFVVFIYKNQKQLQLSILSVPILGISYVLFTKLIPVYGIVGIAYANLISNVLLTSACLVVVFATNSLSDWSKMKGEK
ncbi:hypothetical protein N9P77_01750 [Amylibacter sp.]|nr:hypothetical protein [Amylibacter sp.]